MSTTVDERIVSMQFDNRNFEKNVSTSLSTLDKLKQSLNFKGSTKGLEAISAAAQNQQVDFRNLEATACTSAFSFRDVWIKVANVFEYQIAGKIIDASKRMISSLTIDPIKTGLQEYETQLNSVQTILANTESKGSTLEDVNKALDELNLYADKTIYNFTEMTRNIGTFTAAGVDLETSVSAIKGIANLAAVSGSTSQQASTAMYQLSQALSTGTVRLMDWNSVVNAGMGGQVFQDALKETARVHGVAIDDIIKQQGSFRESLSEGWLSSEILLETLNKFTGDLNAEQLKSMGYTEKQITEILKLGETANNAATKVKTFTQLLDTLKESAQSGWAQTWELIIGDFEAARSMWTKVSDVIGGVISDSAEARNALLSGTLNSGLTQLFEAGIMDESGYEKYLKAVAKEHGVALDKMIEEEGSLEKALRKGFETKTLSSDMLAEAVSRLSGEYGELSAEQLKNKGYTQEQVDALLELNKNIQNGSISMDEFADKMSKLSGRELLMESFANIWKSLVSIITPIKEAFREIFPPTTSNQLYKIIEAFKNFTSKLILTEEQSAKLKQTFKGLFSILDIIWTAIKTVVGAVFDLLGNFSGLLNVVLSITAAFGKFILGIRNSIKESKILSKTAEVITKAVQNIIDGIKQFASALKQKFQTSGFDGFIGVIKFVWNLVKTIFGKIADLIGSTFNGDGDIFGFLNTLIDLLNAGLLASLIVKFKGFFSSIEEVANTFGGVFEDLFGGLGDTLKAFQDKLKAETLKKIATALLIVAASLLVVSLIDKDKLSGAISAIGISLGMLMGALMLIGKKDLFKNASGIAKLTTLAASLLILSFALKKLGNMSWDEIARGLVAMTAALAVMTGSLYLMSKISSAKKMSQKGANQLIKMSFALLIVASSLKILATMSWDAIARSLTAMTGAISVMVGALYLMSLISSNKQMSQKGANQLIKMSFGLLVVASSLKILSTISWDGVARGLTAMGGAFVILTATLAILSTISSNKKMAHDGSKQLLKLSSVLLLASASLKILSTISWDGTARGLTAMTGAFVILVGTIAVLSTISSKKQMATKGAGLILTLSTALLTASVSLKLLSTLGWDEVGRALTAMAGAFVILVGSVAILSKLSSGGNLIAVAGSILILSAAMGVLVPTLLILGNMKISTIIQGLLTMAAALAIFGAAGLLLQGVVPAIIGLSASMLMFGAGIFLVTSGIAILAAGFALLITSITAFVTAIVAGGSMAVALIVSLVKQLIELIPLLLTKFAQGIIDFCKVIRDGAPVVGETFVALLLAAINSCVQVIPELANGLLQIILGVLRALNEHIPEIVEVLVDLLVSVIESIALFLPKLITSAVGVFAKFFDGIIAGLQTMDPTVLLKALAAVGLIAAIMAALGAITALVPGAMLGILGVGAVMAELAIVLIAVGALTKCATSFLPGIGSDLGTFMTNITPFINGLRLIDNSLLQNAKNLASLLLTVTATSVIESLTSWFTGGVSMKNFADELIAYGKGISGFAEEVNGVDGGSVEQAAKAGKAMIDLVKSLPKSGGLKQLFSGEQSLSDFSNQLEGFGKGIKKFAESIQGVSGKSITSVMNAIKTLFDTLKTIPNNVASDFKIANTNLINVILDVIQTNTPKVVSAFDTMYDQAVSSANSPDNATKTFNAGASIVQGLANGIKNMASIAIAQAVSLATSVANAISSALKINSPSKLTIEDGESIGEGLVVGLDNYSSKVCKAGANIADDAMCGLSSALIKTCDLIENGIDSQPTIRPVLDLSNIESGIGTMNSMFNMSPSVGVLSRVGSINSSMNKNQNESDDIASVIKDLKNTLQTTPGNVYNFGNVTYSAGDEIDEAVQALIRAIKVGGRV